MLTRLDFEMAEVGTKPTHHYFLHAIAPVVHMIPVDLGRSYR